MKIKRITKLKKNIYNVILENDETIKLFEDVILKHDLLIDKRIDDKKIKSILFDNDVMNAYYDALSFLNIKMRCTGEIVEKLKSKDYSENIIQEVLKLLEKQNYLNDELYIETFINDSINLTLNGPFKIKRLLVNKGLSETRINFYLDKIDDKIWNEKIGKIINKRSKINKDGEFVFKTKTTNYLLNQGYESNLIEKNMSKVEIDTKNNLEKTAQKEWQKLSKKYKGNTLIYKFKSNMFKKGFKSEDVNDYLKDII